MSVSQRFRQSCKKWKVIAQFLSLFLCCSFLIVSCGGYKTTAPTSPNSTAASNNGRLVVGLTDPPRTLDPADNYEVYGSNIITSLGDRLYTYKLGSVELEPQLATELPKISADGLTYTIPLRKGVVFHDGTNFDAKAMEFSLNRFIKNGGKPSTLLADLVESVKATGDYELTIKIKNSFAPFPSLLAFTGMCAVSPKAYEIGTGKFKPNEFVGTGPYKLASFSPQQIKLDVFDKYWGQKPANKGIDFQIFPGSSANLYNSFTTGAVDVAYLTLDSSQIINLKSQAATKAWQVTEATGGSLSYMVLNIKQKPLDQVEVRQAIASLIDRPLLTKRVYRDQAEPAYSLIPNSFDTSKPVFKDTYGDGNVEKAKQLLTKAGFSKAKPFTLDIYYSSNSAERAQVVSTIKEYIAQKLDGVMQVIPKAVETATLFANIEKGLYPSYLVAWLPDFGDADNYIQPFLSCSKGSAEKGCEQGASQTQGSFYYSEQMNKLIEAQRKEKNPEARKKIFAEIQDLLAKDVPIIPLWLKKDYIFSQKNIKDVKLNVVLGPKFWLISKS
ncbi:MAG: ABC transporter substrate-binding protein [Coleofasciculaceae cyanobacterium]